MQETIGRVCRAVPAWLAGLVAGWLLALAPAAAQTSVVLDAAAKPHVSLDTAAQAWTDAGGQASPQQLASDSAIPWQATAAGTVYPLRTGQALWLRFSVTSDGSGRGRWFLAIPYPSVNRVTLFSADPAGGWVAQTAGDTLPVASWPVPHRHPLLPLALAADREPQQFLLRVENPHNFSAPLAIVSEAALLPGEQRISLILGIYFGLAALVVVLALFDAVSLRDSAFGWYALAVVVMGMAQGSMVGLNGLHLWPALSWWNDVAALALPVLAVGCLVWFLAVLVSLPQRSRRLFWAALTIALLSLPTAAAIMLVEPSSRYVLMVGYVGSGSAMSMLLMAWAVRRGDPHGAWLLVGLAPLVGFALFPLARAVGLIPASFWTAHGMLIGIAVELPLLLMVLMLRSQQRRENRRRLHGLDRIDPATGLINAPMFLERLDRMISRAERLQHQSAVVLVDIANQDQIRRDFDRRSAEEMPLRVAGRLLSAARDIDTVARLSDLRFGMLVEGPLSPEDAESLGARLVARCLMPFKDKPPECVPQVQVAQALVPRGQNAAAVAERLHAVLAAVPAGSKRAVFTVG